MSSLKSILDKVDREIVADVQRVHVGAQLYRFLRVALFAFAASLPLTIDKGTVSWAVLASLGAGALETAFRQLYPAFPLNKATSVVTNAVKEQATQLATAAINAQVENYQAGLQHQALVTAMLAAQKTASTAPSQAGHPAEAEPSSPDAKPPAGS